MLRYALLALASVAALVAADSIAGEWKYTMPGPGGEPVTSRLVLETSGETLTGTFHFSESRKLTIENGTFDGKTLKFVVKRDRPQGGTIVYHMQGTVDGSKIKGTVETDMGGQKANSEWSAERQ